MSSNYTVIFDACVLYPAPLRSLLMYLALSGEFRARWTNDIQAVRHHRASLKNPPFTATQYLDCLLKQKLPEAVSQLSEFKALF